MAFLRVRDNDGSGPARTPSPGSRVRRGLVIGAVTAGLLALGVGSASAAEPVGDRIDSATASDMHIEKSDLSVYVMITNNSSYPLVWSG
jgi:hypothetical protein